MSIEIKKLTATEIIDETVAYYGEDPKGRRSMSIYGVCSYNGLNGNKCAYAKCWKEGVYKKEYEYKTPLTLEDVVDPNSPFSLPDPDDLVQEQYKGHSRTFWRHIQGLHDIDLFWNLEENKGLIELGIERVKELKRIYE